MDIPGFCGGMFKGRSFAIDGQECMNLYPENNGPYANGQTCLIGTPGKELFTTIRGIDGNTDAGENRGFITTAEDRFFAVVGNGLFEIAIDGGYQRKGSLSTYTGKVSIIENQGNVIGNINAALNQLVIADGQAGYVFDLDTNIFKTITHECYPAGNSLVSIDGYILQNEIGTQWIYYTTDGLTWDAGAIFAAEGSPDNIKCLAKVNNELWAFGSKSTEIGYDSGANVDNPFQWIKNAFVEIGIEAPHSVATLGNTIFWLGSNAQGHGTVWMATGYQPKNVSSHAIEYILNQISKNYGASDAVAYAYQDEGHSFYVLTFLAANRTLVYDQTTDLWHERGYWNHNTGCNDRDLAICHTFWRGENFVGDHSNSNIYKSDLDVFTDNGNVIKRVRSCGHLHNDRKRVFFKNIEFDIERGVGLSKYIDHSSYC